MAGDVAGGKVTFNGRADNGSVVTPGRGKNGTAPDGR